MDTFSHRCLRRIGQCTTTSDIRIDIRALPAVRFVFTGTAEQTVVAAAAELCDHIAAGRTDVLNSCGTAPR